MTGYAFALPFAIENEQSTVLLAERNIIIPNTKAKAPSDIIPQWAGQWSFIGDQVGEGESPEDTAVRALREQVGVDLTDQSVVTNFVLGNRTLVLLKNDQLTPFYVMCIFTTSTALKLLSDACNAAILKGTGTSGLIASTSTFPIDKARLQVGVTAPPANGWRGYLVENYYGGKDTGILDTEPDILTSALTKSANEDPGFFTAALSDTE
ncbi:NUDIX hydrolase [Pseudomonadota bacterium]